LEAKNEKLGTKKGVLSLGAKVANLYWQEVIAEPSWNQGTKEPRNQKTATLRTKSKKPRTKKGVFFINAKVANLYRYYLTEKPNTHQRTSKKHFRANNTKALSSRNY
jgi:hypothetical protein